MPLQQTQRGYATPVDGPAGRGLGDYAFEVAASNLRFGEGVTRVRGYFPFAPPSSSFVVLTLFFLPRSSFFFSPASPVSPSSPSSPRPLHSATTPDNVYLDE